MTIAARVRVMGILNVTPDSFSDGGLYLEPEAAVERALEMVEEGADLIDVGGCSTRPGAEDVPEEEELRRILPVLRSLRGKVSVPLSIDTTRALVARTALEEGAGIVNDVSAFRGDPGILAAAAERGATVVAMHMRGTPKTMQQGIRYGDLIAEITAFLRGASGRAARAGIPPERVWVDPGIGFGKEAGHNLRILARLGSFKRLGHTLLVGPSRKSFIGAVLDLPVGERLMGTSAAVACAVLHGADVVRVHDVKAMVQVVRMAEAIRESGGAAA